MIAVFPHAVGGPGGPVPAGAPAAVTSAPIGDGFDALLGQATAALLATVAESGDGDRRGLGLSTPAGHADEAATGGHDAVDPASSLLPVPAVPTMPVLELPHQWTSCSAEPAGADQPVEAPPASPSPAGPPSAGASLHASSQTAVSPDGGPYGHVDARLATPLVPPTAVVGGEVGVTSVNGRWTDPLPAPDPPPVPDPATDVGPVEAPPPSRNPAPLPFETWLHERPIGRRAAPAVAPAALRDAPPTPIAPAIPRVDPMPAGLPPVSTPLRDGSDDQIESRALPSVAASGPAPQARLRRALAPYAPQAAAADAGAAANAGSLDHAVGASPPGAEPAAAPVVPMHGPAVESADTMGPPPQWTQAVRARALAGALEARVERRPDHPPPKGLVAQVDRTPAPPDATGLGAGAEAPARRQTRVPFTPPGGGEVPATAATTAADAASAALDRPSTVTPPMGRAWRAALTAADGAELVAPASSAHPLPPSVTPLGPFVRPPNDDAPVALETPIVEAPTLDVATSESVHGQIVRSLRLQWTGGLGEARVTLRPEFLGEVVATITVEQGVVSATLQADTPEVRRWMEAHATSLRDALVEHGLRLDRLTVAEPARETADADRQGRSRGRQPETPPQRPRRRASDGPTPQFDVTP